MLVVNLFAQTCIYGSALLFGVSTDRNFLSPVLLISDASESVESTSANAARLLLNPSPPASSMPSSMALQQLAKQRALQDDRLKQCQEIQKDWEQCFFYGTGGDKEEGETVRTYSMSPSPMRFELSTTKPNNNPNSKTKIPTW